MTARPLPARWRGALVALLVVVLGGWEPFRTSDPDVEAGNRAYAEGRYDDALAAYDRAARRGAVDGDGLAFDRGTALFKKAETTRDPAQKQRLIERALEDLKQAGHARDPRIRGGAHYNRGNLLMSQDKLDDAIEAYKQALRDQPELDDARHNLELALHRRRKQQQQQAQRGGPGQGQPGQGQGQGQQGGRNGQGQGQQGAGPQGPGTPGQGAPGSPGASPPGGGNPPGAPPDGAGGSGASPPDGGNSAGASPPGGANSPGSAPGGGNNPGNPPGQGSGANPPAGANPGDGRVSPPPRGRPQRGRGLKSPRTPIDGKLDDLDNYSRRLQKDEARRRATGRTSDPQHDW